MAVGLVAPRQREVDGQPMILVPPLPVGANLRRTMEPALGVLLRPVVRKMRDQVPQQMTTDILQLITTMVSSSSNLLQMKLGEADVFHQLLPGTPASGVAPLVEDPFGEIQI